MGDISVLPGIERRDIGKPVPSQVVLQAAIDNGVTDVIILGRSRDGSLYMAAEEANADALAGKVLRGLNFIVDCQVVHR